MAPSAWAQSSYPELRALIGARFLTVLASGIAGGILGMELGRRRLSSGLMPAAWVVLALGVSLYFASLSLRQTAADWPRYEKWALFWDSRDRAVRDARAEGIMDMEVVEIDHIVPRVGELQPDDNFWYSNCAEDCYDVRSLPASRDQWPSPDSLAWKYDHFPAPA